MQSPPFPRYLLGPYILLNTIFSNTLSFLSSLNVNDQVTHPYKTSGKIIVLYTLFFKFLDSNLEDKRFCTEWYQAFPDLNLLLISSAIEFWFVKVVPKYYEYHHNLCCFMIFHHCHFETWPTQVPEQVHLCTGTSFKVTSQLPVPIVSKPASLFPAFFIDYKKYRRYVAPSC